MNSFTLYSEYFDLITLIPSEKEQADLCWKICKYMFLNEEPVLNESQMKVFKNLKRPLDKSKKKGQNGASNKSNDNQNEIETESKRNQNEIKTKTHQDVNVYVNSKEENKGVIGEEETKRLESNKELYVEIIGYLNAKTGSNYRATTPKTKQLIQARLNEKFTLEDFKIVIDKKTLDWLGDEKMGRYLRPETLFGTKFEGYLNEKQKKPICLNQNIEKESMTDEEQNVMEEMLKKYE